MRSMRRCRPKREETVVEAVPADAPPQGPRALFIHPSLRVVAMGAKGRGVIATSAIPAGTLILREPAYASLPFPVPDLCTRCARTLHPGHPDITCSNCGAPFCSYDCRQSEEQLCAHWLNCRSTYENSTRLALQTLIAIPPRLRHLITTPPPLPVDGRDLKHIARSERDTVALIASLPVHMTASTAKDHVSKVVWTDITTADPVLKQETEDQAAQLVRLVRSNAFSLLGIQAEGDPGYLTPSWKERGIALFPSASLFNHSCRPNTYWTMPPGQGDVMVMRAERAIAQGEEISVIYAGNVTCTSTPCRRPRLASTWHFECGCPEACGSPSYWAREGEFWGVTCPRCPGPGALLPSKWADETVLLKRARDGEVGPLGVRCSSCGFETTQLDPAWERELVGLVEMTGLGSVGGQSISRSQLRAMMDRWAPGSHYRLLGELRLAHADRDPEAYLSAVEAVLAGRAKLAGAERLQQGIDNILFARVLAEDMGLVEEAAKLHAQGTAIFANHFGPRSVFATQTFPHSN